MLFVTYSGSGDGMGAQYQRIVGIICLVQYYGYTYVHTKLNKIGHINNKELISQIDNYFGIEKKYKNVDEYKYDVIIDYKNGNLSDYDINDKNVLLIMQNSFRWTENNTDIYYLYMPVLRELIMPRKTFLFDNESTNIAIHVRRRDVNLKRNIGRYVPISTIKKIIEGITLKYIDKKFKIHIFTEITDDNKDEFSIFSNDENIKIFNDNVIDTINHMIYADVLIMTKSSFSYIAGLYNKNIVYYTPFWHNPLKNWIDIQSLFH